MKREDLTSEQVQQLRDTLRPTMMFFHRLYARMQETDFREDDRLWLEVKDAYRALEVLSFDLARLSAGNANWTGWIQREEPTAPLPDLDSISEEELHDSIAEASGRLAILSYALEAKQKAAPKAAQPGP
ncbi:unnamed protein product [uncultured bacterium]|nr:unnamed protein product [uncultured bacterium]